MTTKYISIIVCVVIGMCAFRPVYSIQEGKFYAGVLCDLETLVSKGCSHQVSGVKTRNACVFGCSKDPACVGMSIVDKHTCFHHHACTGVSGCGAQEHEHKYLSKNCAHGGVWNPETSGCVCANGWVGEHCLDLPSTCLDLIDLGKYPEGMHRTHLNLANSAAAIARPMPVTCTLSPVNRFTSIRVFANSGNGNFWNRTWDEYRNGFFVNTGNVWIGLENWHSLSKAGYLRFVVFLNVGKEARLYDDFDVKDASHNYSFTSGGTSTFPRSVSINNELPDCFGPFQNSPFSTKDNDKDGVLSDNCADRAGGGWWFSGSCSSECNLLGVFPKDWDRYPEEKWMRLGGTDLQSLRDANNMGIFAYIK